MTDPIRVGDEPYEPGDVDAEQLHAMLASWSGSLLAAEQTAAACQDAGDTIAGWLATLRQDTALADTDPASWWESVWPEAGVETSTILDALRAAMAGLYAKAGAYRRAANELNRVILATLTPEEEAAEARAATGPFDTEPS